MDTDFIKVLNDLYRLGFIGNYLPSAQMYRWQHKGDDRIILSDEWRIMIHQALHSALAVGKKQDYSMKRYEAPQIGDVVTFEVRNISRFFVDGLVNHYGKRYPAYMHISNISDEYIHDINDYVSVGEILKVVLLQYDDNRFKWSTSRLTAVESPSY